MTTDQLQRGLELYRRAKAAGFSKEELQAYDGDLDKIEAAVEDRRKGSSLDWADRMAAMKIRRRKLAGAYLAGASLTQLATLEQVTPVAVRTLVSKELPTELRERIAEERTARGRRRQAIWRPSQISAMLAGVSDQDAIKLPVVALAARMQAAAQSEQDTMEAPADEDDAYLHN